MVRGSSSDPPGAKTSSLDLKRELRKKKEALLDARLKPIEDKAEEAKEIALSAKKEAGAYKNVKFVAVITFLVFAVGAIGAYFTLRVTVCENEKAVTVYKADMTEVKADISEVRDDIQDVKVMVGENKKQAEVKNEKHLERIELVITKAFATQKAKPRRR